MSIQTPLAKVKHLGSARSGTNHFIKQRITAIFMIPLLMWFITIIVLMLKKPANELPWLITSPLVLFGAILFIINSFYHASLGLKMIIEDYIHHHTIKVITLIIMYGIIITTIVAGLCAVFSIYLLVRIS